jgi:hypothetical protein
MQQADQLAVQLAADDAAATASYHAVLLSPIDLFPEVFQFLDRGSKVALRGVSRALRSQVDGTIEVLTSPVGFSDSLDAALERWHRVRDLTLVLAGLKSLAVDSASDLAPLATTTSLAGLKSLSVRQEGGGTYIHSKMISATTSWAGTVGTHAWTRMGTHGHERMVVAPPRTHAALAWQQGACASCRAPAACLLTREHVLA